MKYLKNGKAIPTELTWEDKNPTSYIYRPSKDVKCLIRIAGSKRKIVDSEHKEHK